MKFLFIAPRFHTNQVSWTDSLIDNNHKVYFHSQLKGGIENYSKVEPKIFPPCKLSKLIINVFGEGGINNPRGFPNPLTYFRELKDLNPDVIIVRDATRWFSLLGAILGRVLNIKIIIYSQTELHKHYGALRKLKTKLILKIFRAKWITPLRGKKSEFSTYPEGLYFVPFAVDINKKQKKHQTQTLELLSIGKYEDRKNHLMLLKIFKQLLDEGFLINLTLIGEVSKEKHQKNFEICKHFIEINGLTERVNMRVNIPHSGINEFYRLADLFILPATEEPASISILESVGQGTPAICSDTNGTQYYLLENKFGTTFRDNDPDSLFREIKLLLEDKRLEHFKENIHLKIESILSKSNFYNSLMLLIKDE